MHQQNEMELAADLCSGCSLLTTKHDWSDWCQYNMTGWVSIWAYDMLFQCGSTIKRVLSPTATNRHLNS